MQETSFLLNISKTCKNHKFTTLRQNRFIVFRFFFFCGLLGERPQTHELTCLMCVWDWFHIRISFHNSLKNYNKYEIPNLMQNAFEIVANNHDDHFVSRPAESTELTQHRIRLSNHNPTAPMHGYDR